MNTQFNCGNDKKHHQTRSEKHLSKRWSSWVSSAWWSPCWRSLRVSWVFCPKRWARKWYIQQIWPYPWELEYMTPASWYWMILVAPPKKLKILGGFWFCFFFSHKWDMRILRFEGGEVWSYSLECSCVVAGARLPLQQDWHVRSIYWKGQKGGLFYLQFLHPEEVMAPLWTIPVQQLAAEVRVQ